jgi:hypothetical protein
MQKYADLQDCTHKKNIHECGIDEVTNKSLGILKMRISRWGFGWAVMEVVNLMSFSVQ